MSVNLLKKCMFPAFFLSRSTICTTEIKLFPSYLHQDGEANYLIFFIRLNKITTHSYQLIGEITIPNVRHE
jgi:hypothetical protein